MGGSPDLSLFIVIKEQIIKLHREGKSISEISRIVNRSPKTVRYHLDPKEKQRVDNHRRNDRTRLKIEFGGKCSICSYNRCLDALHFHHPNKDKKSMYLMRYFMVMKPENLKPKNVNWFVPTVTQKYIVNW